MKLWLDIAQSLLTCLAILSAGAWAFYRFIWMRESKPKAEVQHTVCFKKLAASKLLIRVGVTLRNTGAVLLNYKEGFVRIQKVLPCEEKTLKWIADGLNEKNRCSSEADWPVLKEVPLTASIKEIEPGEVDTAYADIIIADELQTVVVYSHLSNAAKNGIGWNHTTLHDVDEGTTEMTRREEKQGHPKPKPVQPPPVPIEPRPEPKPQGPPKNPPPPPPQEPKSQEGLSVQ